MYLQANVNRMIFDTTTINISEGEAEIGLTVSEKYHHKGGAMHGAVYFKLLDDSAYFAANSLVTDYFLLTSSFQINLIRPVVSGPIYAKGTIRSKSKNLIIAESRLLDKNHKEVAFGTGNFMTSKIELNKEIGYE